VDVGVQDNSNVDENLQGDKSPTPEPAYSSMYLYCFISMVL